MPGKLFKRSRLKRSLLNCCSRLYKRGERAGERAGLGTIQYRQGSKSYCTIIPNMAPLFYCWSFLQATVKEHRTLISRCGWGTSRDPRQDQFAPIRTCLSLRRMLAAPQNRALCYGGTFRRFTKHKPSHNVARILALLVTNFKIVEKFTILEIISWNLNRPA